MTETPTQPPSGGRVNEVELRTSMERSYIDYAMAVIVGLAQPWVMRAPLIQGQGNFGSPGNDPAAAMRYTECRMAPLAMEMVRDIEKDTVEFQPNYDGRNQEPAILPARFPNLLVNGSAGIAVGMATNIPPHNLREVAAGALWALEHPDATREELQDALVERIKGPDFPNGALIVGREGIEQAHRTGRGSITQRAVIEVDEDSKGRTNLVITELPYMVNPDNLALVDGVPRTLTIDQFISNWVAHQIDVIQRRTRYRLAEAERQAHIYRGYVKALDALDEVIALIRRSPSADEARNGLIALLDVDEEQ